MNVTRVKYLQILSSLGLAVMLLGVGIGLIMAQSGSLTRLTTASPPGRYSGFPSLNADGSKVAFDSDADFLNQGIPAGQFEIWLYDTATMTMTRLTTASPAGRGSVIPSLSADGSKVAFHSNADFLDQGIAQFQFEIWLYDMATMTVTRVTTASAPDRDSGYPSISADGSKVAFPSNSDFLGQGIPTGQSEIWLYDTATMTVTRLTTSSQAGRFSDHVSLNADGTKVAFDSDADFLNQGIPTGQSEIWLYDTGTMTVTRLTTASAADRDSRYPSLSADGSKVAFDSDSDFLGQGIPAGQSEIWLYDTATMTVTRLTTATPGNRYSIVPSINADGTRVAFNSNADFFDQGIPDSQTEIWLYDTATMTVTRLTTTSPAGLLNDRPIVSANGNIVAFHSDADFLDQGIPIGQFEIWLYSLTSDKNECYLPVIVK